MVDLDPHRVLADGIDADMKRCSWINWEIEGENDKVPKRPNNPRRNASTDDATTWSTFEESLQNAEGRDLGIGFPLAQATPFVAMDVDTPDGGDWVPDLDRLGSALVERSPSGSLRVYLRDVSIPEWWTDVGETGKNTPEVGVYDDSGFVTVTGDALDDHEPPIGDTSDAAFTTWLKEAWRVFNDEDEETPPWEANGAGGGPVSAAGSRGSDGENPTPAGGSDVDIGIYDIISRSAHPPGERTAHPIHGSDTGKNFMVAEDGETFTCWSASCSATTGKATPGHAGHLLGMDVGALTCGEWVDRELGSETWAEIYDAARDAGYDIPDQDHRKGDGASALARPVAEEGDGDGGDDSDPWGSVRRLYANDESEDSKAAMNHAVKLASDDLDVRTHDESEALFFYDSTDGIYHRQGEHRVQEYLNDGDTLGRTFYPPRARNVIETLKYTSYTPEREFGAPADRICVANGVLDVSDPADSDLTSHDPGHLFRRGHPVEYDPDADCPEFMEFIEGSVRDGDVEKLQEYAGYLLHTWAQPYKKALMLVGPTNSGKGTFLRIIEAVVGRDNISNETLEDLTDTRWAAAQLYESVANIRNEMSTSQLKNIERFKEMTGGGDRLSAEFKGKQKFQFTVTQKFAFATNEVPSVEGDDAFNKRWLFVAFPNTVPDPEIDPDLDDRIIENELSGVLNWMLDGYARLRERGAFTGERSIEEKEEMWEKYGSTVDRFKHACLEVTGNDDDRLGKDGMKTLYKAFCGRVGREAVAGQTFTKELTDDENIEHDRDDYIGITADPASFDSLDVEPFGPESSLDGDTDQARLGD